MQIIPVIDLMGGIVVHAQQGQRQNYQPIKSKLCSSVEPKQFIQSLLEFYPFKTLYLADLDAIMSGDIDIERYKNLAEDFPELEFWLDVGVKTVEQYRTLSRIEGIDVIVASESMVESNLLSQAELLSLDFKNGELLGKINLMEQRAAWPKKIIVLSLDEVGAQNGPNIGLLEKIQALAGDEHSLIVGGGIRDEQDLARLKGKGVDAVLVASALHNGRIDKRILLKYL